MWLAAAAACGSDEIERDPFADSFDLGVLPTRRTSLTPGDDIGIEVTVYARESLSAPVAVTVADLPDGVTATAAAVDREESGVLRLKAAVDASPVAATVVIQGRLGDRLVEVPIEIDLRSAREPGTTDTTFGIGGVAMLPTGSQAAGMAVQPDGRIVLLAQTDDEILLVRFDARGAPDPSWPDVRIPRRMFGYTSVRSLSVLPDGNLLVSARYNGLGVARDALLRFAPDGTLRGEVVLDQDGATWHDVVATTEHVTAVGETTFGAAIARFAHDGTRDPTFGTDGLIIEDLRLPDGWAGVAGNGAEYFVAGPGYLGQGSVIGRIGASGALRTAPVPLDSVYGVAIDSRGRGLVASAALGATRFDAEMAIDTSFGEPVATIAGAPPATTRFMHLLPDDGVLLVGSPVPPDPEQPPEPGAPEVDTEGLLIGRLDAEGNTVPVGPDGLGHAPGLYRVAGVGFASDGALLMAGTLHFISYQRAVVTRVLY